MAVIKAAATGNWSATGTWSGGVVPSLNDTVYANGFTVTLDQSIDLTGSTVDASGSFIAGQIYQIVSVGTTNFTLTANCIAPGSNAGTAVAVANTVGRYFQAVNAGTATTGTARRVGALLTFVNTPLTIATGGGFALSSNYNVTGAYIMAGSTAALTVSGTATATLTGCTSVGSAFTGSTRSILFSSSGTLSGVGLIISGGNASGAYGLGNTGAGTVNLTSSSAINGGTFNSDSWGAINSSTGIIQMTSGTITPGALSGGIRNTSTGQIICSGVSALAGYLAAITNESSGSVTFSSGSVSGGNSGGISNSGASGSVTVNNSTISGGTNANTAHGVINNSAGTITTTGCTITGAGTGGGYGIYNVSTGPLVLNSSTINANAVAGVVNNSTGSVTSSGDITATNLAVGLSSTNALSVVIVSGSLTHSANGTVAVYSPKFRMSPAPLVAKTRYALNGTSTYVDMFTADNTGFGPATNHVRSGVSYNGMTGSLQVPLPSQVAVGIATDNTVGTAALTPADVWEYATRTITGGLVDTATTLTNAPTVPTASAIASQVRTELSVELGRVDQNISSRLAAADYTAPSAAPTVTAIRQEMDSNSTKLANLDATVSSRLATSGYTAPTTPPTAAANATAVRTELATELAKVSSLNTDRLANVATTAIVGNLIAQANS